MNSFRRRLRRIGRARRAQSVSRHIRLDPRPGYTTIAACGEPKGEMLSQKMAQAEAAGPRSLLRRGA
jgi:hypothetical protein